MIITIMSMTKARAKAMSAGNFDDVGIFSSLMFFTTIFQSWLELVDHRGRETGLFFTSLVRNLSTYLFRIKMKYEFGFAENRTLSF